MALELGEVGQSRCADWLPIPKAGSGDGGAVLSDERHGDEQGWLVEWKSNRRKTVGHLADLVAQGSEVNHGLNS